MNPYQYVEEAMKLLEQQFHLRITVIDRDGLFNYKQKSEVFTATRHSHQTNPACRIGFCEKCISNCRYRLNQQFLDNPKPCYSVCWKGIGQIAVPLYYGDFSYGILYAGNFRDSSAELPHGLPSEFYEEYKKLPPVRPETIENLISVFHLFANGMITYLHDENIVNNDYDFRISKIYSFLQENKCRNIGLPDIAEHLQLSESYTSSFIKQISGHSFSYLLRSIRIDYAKNLLITTDSNLHAIAKQCGFANEFHFSKVFKETTGLTPSAFRKFNK